MTDNAKKEKVSRFVAQVEELADFLKNDDHGKIIADAIAGGKVSSQIVDNDEDLSKLRSTVMRIKTELNKLLVLDSEPQAGVPLKSREINLLLKDWDNSEDKPYPVKVEIFGANIVIEVDGGDDRPSLSVMVEIDRGVPATHISDAIGSDMVLHLHQTKEGLHICPEVNEPLISDSSETYNYGSPNGLLIESKIPEEEHRLG